MGTAKKMTSAITGIKLNRATFSNELIDQLTYVNFFYGNNGAGKSSIAKAIESSEGIVWSKDITPTDFEVLVYNQEFINRNFTSYGNLKGVYIVNETNTKTYADIEAKKQERKDTLAEHEKARIDLDGKKKICDNLVKAHQESLFQKVAKTRAEFAVALEGKKRADGFSRAISVEKPVAHKLEDLHAMLAAFDESARTYTEFKNVKFPDTSTDMAGKKLLGDSITSSSDAPFAKFVSAIGATDWIRQGHDHYQNSTDGKCPYCQQTLPPTFEDDLRTCFDKKYQQDIKSYLEFKTAYAGDCSRTLQTLKTNLNSPMPTLDLKDYQENVALLEKTLEINQQRLATKENEPSRAVALDDTDSIIEDINAIIDKLNAQIKRNNEAVEKRKDTKAKCKKYILEYFASVLEEDIKNFASEFAPADQERKKAATKEASLQQKIKDLDKSIACLNAQIVNIQTTVDSINKILREAGFQGFYLRARADTPGTYEVIRENHESEGTAKDLSEGERNFIAFLYFYHCVRGSLDSNNIKDKIVVIDDPVSSMDSNALFIVGAIVREMINVCRNNTEYLNPKVPGDYIRQIFILTHNVYFHHEVTYQQVQYYNCASFYIIRKQNNISKVKLCVRKNRFVPSELENNNPVQNSYAALWDELREIESPIPAKNVMRRILDYYFLQLCGYNGQDIREFVLEKHKSKFINNVGGQRPDMTKYELASSMLAYINNPHGITDGLNYVEETDDVEPYKEVFHLIFEALNQEQHYKMMMGINS